MEFNVYQEIDLFDNIELMNPIKDFVKNLKFKLNQKYKPATEEKVSEKRLEEILNSPTRVFEKNFITIKYPYRAELEKTISSLFNKDATMTGSGYWYPKGGYIGWHTNETNIGWRLYISYCQDPGKSYFRYRDPITKDIITSPDPEWGFRIFKITKQDPLWHCVYSDTNRYSIGLILK